MLELRLHKHRHFDDNAGCFYPSPIQINLVQVQQALAVYLPVPVLSFSQSHSLHVPCRLQGNDLACLHDIQSWGSIDDYFVALFVLALPRITDNQVRVTR